MREKEELEGRLMLQRQQNEDIVHDDGESDDDGEEGMNIGQLKQWKWERKSNWSSWSRNRGG